MSSIIKTEDFTGATVRYGFAVGPKEQIANALRRLADAVEENKVLVQKAMVYGCTKVDDFPMHSLVLTWAEVLEQSQVEGIQYKQGEVKNLFSGNSFFPVAKAQSGDVKVSTE